MNLDAVNAAAVMKESQEVLINKTTLMQILRLFYTLHVHHRRLLVAQLRQIMVNHIHGIIAA